MGYLACHNIFCDKTCDLSVMIGHVQSHAFMYQLNYFPLFI